MKRPSNPPAAPSRPGHAALHRPVTPPLPRTRSTAPASQPAVTASDLRHERALVWFRRDLRDFDHAALHAALRHARAVYCAFVFDREILDALARPDDRRVER